MADESPLEADLNQLIELSEADVRSFKGAHICITGGTGFVGSWLLESIGCANRLLNTGIRVSVVTRDPSSFAAQKPHLGLAPWLKLVPGDVRNMPPGIGRADAVIHAATPASASLNVERPLEMFDTIVEGGRTVLEYASESGKIPVLFTSSGAVYGPQPLEIPNLPEEHLGGPDPLSPRNAYHEGKRVGELQCALYAATAGLQCKIARLFAFVGPYLPLNKHFAIGNFIRDALRGGPIVVQGDGSAVRSYLHATDMTAWLWAIFARGKTLRAYNVGSDEALDIASLAKLVGECAGTTENVTIRGTPGINSLPDRYVPSSERICTELGARQTVALADAIARTIAYHRRVHPDLKIL